jgi:hypothetical protein
MTEPTSAQDLFKGRHFDQEIIILCVRWYLAFKLSSRDLVQMMAERGILLAHTTKQGERRKRAHTLQARKVYAFVPAPAPATISNPFSFIGERLSLPPLETAKNEVYPVP